jgi:hypothetical protein
MSWISGRKKNEGVAESLARTAKLKFKECTSYGTSIRLPVQRITWRPAHNVMQIAAFL